MGVARPFFVVFLVIILPGVLIACLNLIPYLNPRTVFACTAFRRTKPTHALEYPRIPAIILFHMSCLPTARNDA
ncbi:hypothetical protein T492DRAFT_1088543 [Pavlovales sp. CCMP2436]|nr:hypothetical protein T492DRAFT_1088543 [Pavlovales sp. CCMP2436]